MQFLKNIWEGYKSIALKIGVFQSKIILTVFYFLLTPSGLFFSLFKDELKIKKIHSSTWIKKGKQAETLSELQQQY